MEIAPLLPAWLREKRSSHSDTYAMKKLLRQSALATVCEEARCPNKGECFSRGTATFMLLGDICSRNCHFCSVCHGVPTESAKMFAARAVDLAVAVKHLELKYVVLTSVTRDDLPDGGATGFVLAIQAIREACPEIKIELLIPDFQGSRAALVSIVRAGPDVVGHNLETVSRLYPTVRPQADYQRSLAVLQQLKQLNPALITKSGIMLGFGETEEEVKALMEDLCGVGVELFTAGQYLQPKKEQLAVHEYLTKKRFSKYQHFAKKAGFRAYAIDPYVRSSYFAEALYQR